MLEYIENPYFPRQVNIPALAIAQISIIPNNNAESTTINNVVVVLVEDSLTLIE
ncbi:MAG: hypothetical protein HRO68_07765 [Nitrosopumilus sp.]|nr:hypothetical protein [Nitrosopumilus sp.]